MALTGDLEALYHLDNDAVDASGNGYDLTRVGAFYNAIIKKIGSHAADLDGIDDWFFRNNVAVVSSLPFSMACWFRKDVAGRGGNGLMWIGDRNSEVKYFYLSASSTELRFEARNTTEIRLSSVNSIEDTDFHLAVAVAVSATSRKLYLDGVYEGESTVSVTLPVVDRVALGVRARSTRAEFHKGQVDEAAIWSRVITDGGVAVGQVAGGEIAELWNGGAGIEIVPGVGGRRRRLMANRSL